MEVNSERLKELWSLLLLLVDDPRTLTDAQLEKLNQGADRLDGYATALAHSSIRSRIDELRRYRVRKAHLAAMSTEELQRMQDGIRRDRAAVMAEEVDDDLPDSFFEAPALDSDRHIVDELLDERKVAR